MNDPHVHEKYMRHALELASEAATIGEVPVGAVVVHEGQIVGEGYNLREAAQNPLAHAEIIAIRQAAMALGSWRLEGTALYVTLEPCPMCAGAIVNARIPRVIYGAGDPKAGAVKTLYTLLEDERLNHRCEVITGVLAGECGATLKQFFAELRKRKR